MMKQVTYMNWQYNCEVISLGRESAKSTGIAAIFFPYGRGKPAFFFQGFDALCASDRNVVEKEVSRRLGYDINHKNGYCGYTFISRPC